MIDEPQVSSRDGGDRSLEGFTFAKTASIKDIIIILNVTNYIFQPNRLKIMLQGSYTHIAVTNYKKTIENDAFNHDYKNQLRLLSQITWVKTY